MARLHRDAAKIAPSGDGDRNMERACAGFRRVFGE
jgi:hypothetical protein